MIKSYKKQFTLITEVKRKHKKKMKLIRKFGYWYLKNKSYFFCFKLKKRMQYKRILDLMLQYLYTHKRRTYLFSKTLANRSFMHNFQNLQTRLDIMLIRVYCCWTIKEALFLIQKAVVCINDIRQTKIQSCFILDKITIKAWFFFTKRKFLPIYNWGVSNYVKGEKSKKQQKRKWIWDYRGFLICVLVKHVLFYIQSESEKIILLYNLYIHKKVLR